MVFLMGLLMAVPFLPTPSAPVREGRPTLVVVTRVTPFCPPCERFKKWEATNPAALRAVRVVKYRTDRKEDAETIRMLAEAMGWKEVPTPTFVLADRWDDVLGSCSGFTGPASFCAWLEGALHGQAARK